MKIDYRNIGQNHALHVYRTNRNLGIENDAASKRGEKAQSDTAAVSLQGRNKGLLESLLRQKISIVERRKELIGKTLEKDETLESVSAQLKVYEEQLKSIDAQIAEAMTREMEKQTEKNKPKVEQQKPKTEAEAQNERLISLSGLSDGLRQAKLIGAANKRIDGDSRVVKKEIELDKFYAEITDWELKPKVERKEAALAEMEKASLRLNSKMADNLADIAMEAADEGKPEEAEEEKNAERVSPA